MGLFAQLARVFRFIGPSRTGVALLCAAIVILAIVDILAPLQIGIVVDSILARHLNRAILFVSAFLAVRALAAILFWIQSYMTSTVTGEAGVRMSQSLFRKVQRLPLDQIVSGTVGELVNRIRGDVDAIVGAFGQTVVPMLMATVMLICALTIMFNLSWKLTLATLISIPCWYWVVKPKQGRLTGIRHEIMTATDDLYTVVAERLSPAGIVRAKLQNAYALDEHIYSAAHSRVLDGTKRFVLKGGALDVWLNLLVTGVGPASVLAYGGWLALHSEISVGLLVAFLGFQSRMYGPVNTIAEVQIHLATLKSVLDRFISLLDASEEQGGVDVALPGVIAFEDVSFCRANRLVLRSVNLRIRPGESVGLVGRSGIGKTTLGELLLRLYDPTSGRVTLGGSDLKDLSLESIRSTVGLVTQNDSIISGSIEDNLRSGLEALDNQNVWSILRIVQLFDFVAELRDGLRTDIGNLGTRFSGGERQRLAIARALLKHPRVLVLDEATSALDQAMERNVLQGIRSYLGKDGILLVITHRLAATDICDRIIAISEGCTRELGGLNDRAGHSDILLSFLDHKNHKS